MTVVKFPHADISDFLIFAAAEMEQNGGIMI
jgi:hypothetical protein